MVLFIFTDVCYHGCHNCTNILIIKSYILHMYFKTKYGFTERQKTHTTIFNHLPPQTYIKTRQYPILVLWTYYLGVGIFWTYEKRKKKRKKQKNGKNVNIVKCNENYSFFVNRKMYHCLFPRVTLITFTKI